MNVAINICLKNIVDSFCRMPIDFHRDKIWGMMCVFTNLLCTVKLLFCVVKLIVLNYTNGMTL